ncbi:hypothetical protein Tco_0845386 [Tanacetum coccineum]
MHMLTKPQVFYDNAHKQSLCYQNPFYLKKTQRIKPTLYDGSVISSQQAASSVIDDEETLILEEISRSKMLSKQKDPMSKEKKLQTSHPNTDQSALSPVKIEALKELSKEAVQDTNLYAQQDSMILSVIEQMSEQMINHVNNWEKANQEKNNESLTVELERYKERVKTFEHCLKIDLSTREKMTDSQMDDMIKEKLALKQQIDSLKQNLFNQIKEKESLLQTFTIFKNESKKRKAQRIKPTLYDGSFISSQHVASHVIDDEETLILEEISRSKMLAKQKDPMSNEKKVNTNPINYVELNQLSKDFVKIKALKELSKVSLVNTSLKNLKYHLGQFDTVVKKRITPDVITEGEWGFEHTKTVFLNEIIPFLKTLKDIFNIFDKDLLNEVTEVQTVFKQMEAVVQQYFVDKQCFKIHKKEPFLENNRLLQKIMSQDVMICVMNSTAVFDNVNLGMQRSESCDNSFDLDAVLWK